MTFQRACSLAELTCRRNDILERLTDYPYTPYE